MPSKNKHTNTKKKSKDSLVKAPAYTKKLVLRTSNENVYAWINQEKTIITNEDTDNSTALSKQEAIDIAKQILEYYQS